MKLKKRHMTRFFFKDDNEFGNVPPRTVVDRGVIHPMEFDFFYLNSHFGGLGTNKPTHYSVLWDENRFSSDKIQQELICSLCFTTARCTKPVSLVFYDLELCLKDCMFFV
ncbi:Argonaute/Dicer protein, PAZ [Artemisia annua]|uniref:Argonaute/Dicer protein, PAZ n=1 Tax=Artemisia annua TaxID=35608 RepID=A0A2U1PQ97_ARTAN|nr:Argonaute/Dicer protein, PAZ [Artemisia annua]